MSEGQCISEEVKAEITEILNQIRPVIQGDGGDVELVEVCADGLVKVRLHGACIGCPGAAMTLKMGIERTLKEKIPQVSEVVCV